MYYVIQIELRPIGKITVLNDGNPFDQVLDAQSFYNEIIMENSKDMLDYIGFKIIEKKEDDDSFDCKIRIMD